MGGFELPEAPEGLRGKGVRAWSQAVVIPTYRPMAADKNPMFLEKRVYQGSSGRVYPLPFTDRISEVKEDVSWEAIHIENEYVRLMILPGLGGRIHVGLDKTNGYDFFYRQNVIKPALVGLAGPWISGGVEFNWPQHHRPSTFMPVDWAIEEDKGGQGVTVWCSEHEPMNRMKGMHGVYLRAGSSLIELKVRLYNRTELPQTFLWWMNMGVRVHERYQAFFPHDVTYVADHAKRAMSRFPLCDGKYYGVDYKKNSEFGIQSSEWGDGTKKKFVPPVVGGKLMYAANDLRWFANIPVPTSYMAMGSKEDFFGGYDHAAEGGVVHVADHRIAPGKKLWTWGNHEFGYAWDRNLSDDGGPYVELMAGVFTDNQPDFSWLMPGETRAWSQYWYPIQRIGAADRANREAAVSLKELKHEDTKARKVRIGVGVTAVMKGARVRVMRGKGVLMEEVVDLGPGQPLVKEVGMAEGCRVTELRVVVMDGEREVIEYQPVGRVEGVVPEAAKEPGLPEEAGSVEELYLIGVHLEQYRHATRLPEVYWREGLRREPGDSRCNVAMGWWHVRRGEFEEGVGCFGRAIGTMTKWNPNPRDGEAYYGLGVALRHLGRLEEAYDAFGKAAWNEAWQSAAHFALARLDCVADRWRSTLGHLEQVLAVNDAHLQARTLKAVVLLRLKLDDEARQILTRTLATDPLDFSAKGMLGVPLKCLQQTRLDLALEWERAGLYQEAYGAISCSQFDYAPWLGNPIGSMRDAKDEVKAPEDGLSTAPVVFYLSALFSEKLHATDVQGSLWKDAQEFSPDYCFPSRLEEIGILREAMEKNPGDARAPYYLGNLFYDKRRYKEAIELWEKAVKLDRGFSIPWRNLGIAYYNVLKDVMAAKGAYVRAMQAAPEDARLLYERDQLWKRTGESPEKRLGALEERMELVKQRDDLTVEYCSLLNQVGEHEAALAVIQGRKFQPWEGGEGLVLGQHVRTQVALGRKTLWAGDAAGARKLFEAALSVPENLGEAWHLLANKAEVHYWVGMACRREADLRGAEKHWEMAAGYVGDFQQMSVREYSEMSFFSGLALKELGRFGEAEKLFTGMLSYAEELAKKPARIDYFATSLPAMLLFDEDLEARQRVQAALLEALARCGLNEKKEARRLLGDILRDEPSHSLAVDLMVAIDWE